MYILETSKFGEELLVKTYLFSGKEYDEKRENVNSKLYIRLPSEKFLGCFVRTRCFLDGKTHEDAETDCDGFINDYASLKLSQRMKKYALSWNEPYIFFVQRK